MPESVLCPGAVPRLAGGCASDDRDTRNYWIMAPGAEHHPLRRNPIPTHVRHEELVVPLVQDLRTDIRVAAESRVTLQRAITNYRTRGMLETTLNQSERPGRRIRFSQRHMRSRFSGR